jgi:hypothetical protein
MLSSTASHPDTITVKPHGTKRRTYVLLAVLWSAVIGVVGFQIGISMEPPPQVVYREPKEDELVVINGCVVSACQFLASVRAQHGLDTAFWSRVMLVRYKNNSAGHAYCVWETDGHIFGYDRNNGGYPIPTRDRAPKAIAEALAVELGKVMNKEMLVERAEFIEPRDAKLYAY